MLTVCACKKPADADDGQIFDTGDEGIFDPEVDLPSDETDGEPDPVALPTGQCIQLPEPYVYGYVHQCEGSVEVSFQADSYSGGYFFTFGPGASIPDLWVDPDSYDLPLVAACCGPYDYANATFEQKAPYINNCLVDAAQQICHGIPHLLRKAAEEAESTLDEIVLKAAANQLEDRELECLHDLWSGGPTDDESTRLLDRTWTPQDGVSFTIVDAEVFDWTVEGEVAWNTCGSMFENDPAVIPTAPFQVPGTVAMAQASLLPGTTVAGSGPGDSTATLTPSPDASSLTLASLADGTLRVSGLLLEAGPSTVDVYGLEGRLDRSSVTLGRPLEPRLDGGEYSVGTGSASFVVTAVFEGDSRTIIFTNADPIVFRETAAGDWEFDPFDLSYVEEGIGTWRLSFDGLLFRVS